MTPREAEIGTKAKCKKCQTEIEMTAKGWSHTDPVWFTDHSADPAPPEAPKDGSGTKPSPFNAMPMQKIDMTPYVVAMRQYITELDMACGVELRARLDHLMRKWSFELSAYMASVKHKEEVKEKTRSIKVTLKEYVEVPSSWWQHFKFEWFPQWALDIWPVDLMKMHVQHSEDIAVHVVENHITKVCPHMTLKKGPHHLAWMAGDSRYDEVEEQKEVWRLRDFIMRLIRPYDHDPGPSNLSYECSPKVHEEAKKALDGK